MRNIISVFNFFARKRNPLIIICSHLPRRTSRGIDVLKTFDNYNLHPEPTCPSHEGVNSRITLGCWHPRKKCCFGRRNIISVFNFFARKRNPIIIPCSQLRRRTFQEFGLFVSKHFQLRWCHFCYFVRTHAIRPYKITSMTIIR